MRTNELAPGQFVAVTFLMPLLALIDRSQNVLLIFQIESIFLEFDEKFRSLAVPKLRDNIAYFSAYFADVIVLMVAMVVARVYIFACSCDEA
jgi:hypothetical protein